MASVVGEGYLHRYGLALVCVGQRVGAVGGVRNSRLLSLPLVGEGSVVQPVGVGDSGGVRR